MKATRVHLRPSEEQQERFLELIAQGKTRQEAAEEVESTATQFRTFINGKGEESLAYAERYLAALEEAGNAPSPFAARIKEMESVQLAHRVLDESIMRALDSERGKVGASNRILYNLAILNVESFKPLLEARTRHIHEGAVGIYALPQIDTDKWTLAEHERWVELEQERNALIDKARPDSVGAGYPQRALVEATAERNGDIVDAEVVEIVE